MKPILSIIVPAYNCENYISECLESVFRQMTADCELIVVDDGSSDATPQILETICNSQGNVRFLPREHSGASGARNAGLSTAKGEYVTFHDCDDCLADHFLETAIPLCRQKADLLIFGLERVYLDGSFLSGGVDSSYLLASSGVREAIGIGFQESGFSEAPAAAVAAGSLGVHFRELSISAEQYFEVIPQFLRNLELPLADPSAPAFAIGCIEAAKKPGLCLSGEGADEFFAGYRVYRRVDELGREGALYCGCSGIMDQEAGMQLLGTKKRYPLENLIDEVNRRTCAPEPLSRMQTADIALWLEGDILLNAGRTSRANGLDLLLPFADQRMFELSAAIPSMFKRKDGIGKYILRKAAETRLPREIAFRRKIGFAVPVKQWFREERFRSQIEQVLFGSVSQTYFDQEILRSCWNLYLGGKNESCDVPYMVYIYVLWYENCYKVNHDSRKEIVRE